MAIFDTFSFKSKYKAMISLLFIILKQSYYCTANNVSITNVNSEINIYFPEFLNTRTKNKHIIIYKYVGICCFVSIKIKEGRILSGYIVKLNIFKFCCIMSIAK